MEELGLNTKGGETD